MHSRVEPLQADPFHAGLAICWASETAEHEPLQALHISAEAFFYTVDVKLWLIRKCSCTQYFGTNLVVNCVAFKPKQTL